MHTASKDHKISFENFLKEVRPLLFSFVYRVCGDGEDAEDIVQNAMVEAFLHYSENKQIQPTALWSFRITYEQVRLAISNRKPWQPGDNNLIAPVLTSDDFWKKISGENCDAAKRISQQESFHIGFLTILQRLSLIDRVAYVGIFVLGFSNQEMSEVIALSPEEISLAYDRAHLLMTKHYFTRDPAHTLWRSEYLPVENLSKFVKILNAGERESFKSAIDPVFHCILAPAPLFEEEIFFNDFLSQVPSCRLLDFEMNGQPVLVFEDDEETQAVAVALYSKKGVATLLGYDVELLSPKIRSMIEAED